MTFSTAGSNIVWKAYLNGTLTETPVLDFVSFDIHNKLSNKWIHSTVGQITYTLPTAPVAITAYWNATTPSGTGLQVEFQDTSTKTFQYSGETKTVSMTTGYIYVYVRYTSTGLRTQCVGRFQICYFHRCSQNVGIDVGGDGSNEWTSQGVLFGSTTRGGIAFVNEFNDLIPDTGAGSVSIPVYVTAESAGIVVLERFSVTYSINTVNLDINIPEGEIFTREANHMRS